MAMTMIKTQIIILVVLLVLLVFYKMTETSVDGFINYIIIPARRRFWRNWHPWVGYRMGGWRYVREGFDSVPEKINKGEKNMGERDDMIMDYPPNSPSVADITDNVPYHLLKDQFRTPCKPEQLSQVNSRSCYATDFQRMIEKTGNYSQLTNNYKRGYPDSCTGTYQELTSSFYSVEPMKLV
jgi:hypothetical protein